MKVVKFFQYIINAILDGFNEREPEETKTPPIRKADCYGVKNKR